MFLFNVKEMSTQTEAAWFKGYKKVIKQVITSAIFFTYIMELS